MSCSPEERRPGMILRRHMLDMRAIHLDTPHRHCLEKREDGRKLSEDVRLAREDSHDAEAMTSQVHGSGLTILFDYRHRG